jgi:hypothetical protein
MLVGGSYSVATDSARVYIQLSNADAGDRYAVNTVVTSNGVHGA